MTPWCVVVEQLGEVSSGMEEDRIRAVFEDYKEMAANEVGRMAGHKVVLFHDGHIAETFSPPRQTHASLVECPKCGNTELGTITHLENTALVRKLSHVTKTGVLLIESTYRLPDDDKPTNQRLFCTKCYTGYAVPQKHEFV